jgi:hypothetical protein
MYCAKDLTITTCNCDKSIKPTTKNRTNEVKFSRNCFYLLNNSDQTYVKKIQESVIKFNYNVDLNKSFHYTLCSSCNGKTYREKKSFKIIMNMNQLQILYLLLLQPTTPFITFNNSPISNETEDLHLDPLLLDQSFTTSSLSEISDSPLTPLPLTPLPQESFKFKLQIKDNNDTSSQPSSLIAIEDKPSDIFEFKEKICESLDEKYGLLNYGKFKMIYKTENSHGAGNWLNNEHEFNDFLNYCEKLKKSEKMMLVIVNVQSKRKVSF